MDKPEMSSDLHVKSPIVPSEPFGYLEEPKEGWMFQESSKEKFIRKVKENPLVPFGVQLFNFNYIEYVS